MSWGLRTLFRNPFTEGGISSRCSARMRSAKSAVLLLKSIQLIMGQVVETAENVRTRSVLFLHTSRCKSLHDGIVASLPGCTHRTHSVGKRNRGVHTGNDFHR